jgi:hypothetical protein
MPVLRALSALIINYNIKSFQIQLKNIQTLSLFFPSKYLYSNTYEIEFFAAP